MPDTIIIISDMEIDVSNTEYFGRNGVKTMMEAQREKWAAAGLKMPKLIYWNVDARNNTFLDDGPGVSYVSGASPVLFEQILKGVTGYELMLEKLMSERYKAITV